MKESSFANNKKNQALLFDIIFSIWFLGSIMVKCFYFQFTTRLNERPFISPHNLYMLAASFGEVLIIFAISFLLFNKRRKTSLIVINIVLSLLLFADTLYFRYYYNAITIPVLRQIGLVSSVGDSIVSLLKVKDIVYIIDIPAVIATVIILKRFKVLAQCKIDLLKRAVFSVLLVAVAIGIFQVSYHKTDTSTFPYDNNYVIKKLGIIYFHYYDTKRFINEKVLSDLKLTQEEINLVNNFYKDKTDEGDKFEGIARGKNLIVIQVEALQEFVINREFNGREITPNLNKYMYESIYFDNFYYQIGGGNTSDAELLCNASLYPVKEGAVYFRFPTNTFYTLPRLLENKGYKTYVSHANNPSFWNRTEAYKAIGFDRFFSNKDYILDDIMGWGLSDSSMFRQTLDLIDTKEPFYWFAVTLSTHHPFNFFETYNEFDSGEFEGTFLGNYLKAAHYADKSIGELIQLLKDKGLYDNSLIVIYGDHSAVQKDYIDQLEKFLGKQINDYEWTKLQKVPCFIHYPGLEEKGINNTIGGQVDLFPTIANLMGFETTYAMGKDLLNTDRGYAVLRTGYVVTDEYYYINSTGQAYSIEGVPLNTSKYTDEIRSFQQQLLVSDIIVKKNAFKQMGFDLYND
ncbi:MAG: LTA synthase family protein [Acetivibrionales bacterium]